MRQGKFTNIFVIHKTILLVLLLTGSFILFSCAPIPVYGERSGVYLVEAGADNPFSELDFPVPREAIAQAMYLWSGVPPESPYFNEIVDAIYQGFLAPGDEVSVEYHPAKARFNMFRTYTAFEHKNAIELTTPRFGHPETHMLLLE